MGTMKILCHAGPWCADYFRAVAQGFEPSAGVEIVSGFKSLDETGVAEAYYRYLAAGESAGEETRSRDIEIVARCRIMRSLPVGVALSHVAATRRAVKEALCRVRPDVFLSEAVDQFLHDILFEESNTLGIPSYGIVQSFVNGFFRPTAKGERVFTRNPPEEEVAKVRQILLDKSYTPHMIAKQKNNLINAYRQAWLSNNARVLWFSFKRITSGERYNYHYWASSRGIFLNHSHIIPTIFRGHKNWRERIGKGDRRSIFVPLQFFPEATIDYWTHSVEYINYCQVLNELLVALSQSFDLVVKEHPGVFGHRKPEFYRMLRRVPNVTICPTLESAQTCIEACDATLVWTGSVGFEAALRGKPVLTVAQPYYMTGGRFRQIRLDSSSEAIVDFIDSTNSRPVSRNEQEELIRFLLGGLLPGRIQVDGSFDPTNPEHVKSAQEVGAALRNVHTRW